MIHEIAEMERLLDLDHLGLGHGLMNATAAAIKQLSMREEGPDGNAWAPLHPDYLDWKRAQGELMAIGRLHGLMLDDEQLKGERAIGKDRATMTYGTTPEARAEATQFQEGGAVTGTGQPPRPFYALGREAIEETNEVADAMFEQNFDYFFPG